MGLIGMRSASPASNRNLACTGGTGAKQQGPIGVSQHEGVQEDAHGEEINDLWGYPGFLLEPGFRSGVQSTETENNNRHLSLSQTQKQIFAGLLDPPAKWRQCGWRARDGTTS